MEPSPKNSSIVQKVYLILEGQHVLPNISFMAYVNNCLKQHVVSEVFVKSTLHKSALGG